MKKLLMSIFLFTPIIYQGCSGKKAASGDMESSNVVKLEKIQLETLDGNPIDLTAYSGQRIFINFWATWCKPCLQEMPSIQKAMEQVGNEVVFLFPSNETVEEINAFKEQRPFLFEYVRIKNLEDLNFYALPATLIFDTKGELAYSEIGLKDWATDESINLILSVEN